MIMVSWCSSLFLLSDVQIAVQTMLLIYLGKDAMGKDSYTYKPGVGISRTVISPGVLQICLALEFAICWLAILGAFVQDIWKMQVGEKSLFVLYATYKVSVSAFLFTLAIHSCKSEYCFLYYYGLSFSCWSANPTSSPEQKLMRYRSCMLKPKR